MTDDPWAPVTSALLECPRCHAAVPAESRQEHEDVHTRPNDKFF